MNGPMPVGIIMLIGFVSAMPMAQASVTCQTVDINDAKSLNDAFQAAINTLLLSVDPTRSSSLPKDVQWWVAANAWTAVTLKDRRGGDEQNRKTIEAVFARALNYSSPTFELNSFNDDQAWWALWACEAARTYGDASQGWLAAAKGAWMTIQQTWTDECGGGVPWDRSQPPGQGKKAIPNGLLLLLSSKLHALTGESQYLEMATRVWGWLSGSGLVRSDGLVADSTQCNKPTYEPSCYANISWATYSYNTGVVISALTELYRNTKNGTYLAAASTMAQAAVTSSAFLDPSGAIREGCNCGQSGQQCCESCGAPFPACGDGVEFRGPYVRGLSDLYQVEPLPQIKELIQRSLRGALAYECTSSWQLGPHWYDFDEWTPTTSSQIPALELFAANCAVLIAT